MKPVGNFSVHTHNLCKIMFIQYNQIRYKIENLLSCLGWGGKRWLPIMVLLKMQCPSFFYHYSTFTSFKMEKSLDNCTNSFFSFLFLSQDSMHRIIQLEYSISTCFTKIYMVQETRNKNNCTAVRKVICRVQIVIYRTHCRIAFKHRAKN